MGGTWPEKVSVGENTRPRELGVILGRPPRKFPTSEGHRGEKELVKGSSFSPLTLTVKKTSRAGESYDADVAMPVFCGTGGGEWCHVDGLRMMVFSWISLDPCLCQLPACLWACPAKAVSPMPSTHLCFILPTCSS